MSHRPRLVKKDDILSSQNDVMSKR